MVTQLSFSLSQIKPSLPVAHMIQIFVLLRLDAAILLLLRQEALIKQVRWLLIKLSRHFDRIHISREGAFLDQLLRVVQTLALWLGVISALATG